MLTHLVSMLLLLGRCPHLTVALLARMLQGALLAPMIVEPFEQLVLDHADPAGQHVVILDTAGSLEQAVVENILDGRPMEGITCP